LPKNDPSAWNTAAQIALQLGRQAAGALFNVGAAFDGEIPDDIRSSRNLIVVGLPGENQLLADLNDSLPAKFEKGSNVAVIQGEQVSYRFPTDSDLGYLELLNSPWNADRVILAVVGSTAAGVQQAGTALTDPILRSRLKGNFVLVNGQTLSVADTRTGLGLASVGEAANVSPQQAVTGGTESGQASNTVFSDGMGWIPLVAGGLAVIIIVVIVIAVLTRRRVVVHR
jgi:hypothetical protein